MIKIPQGIKKYALPLVLAGSMALISGCASVGNYLANRANDLIDPITIKLKASGGLGINVKATELVDITISNTSSRYETGIDNGKPIFREVDSPRLVGIPGNQLVTLLKKSPCLDSQINQLSEESQKEYFGIGGYDAIPWRTALATTTECTNTQIIVKSEEQKAKLIQRFLDNENNPEWNALKASDPSKEALDKLIRVDPNTDRAKSVKSETHYYLTRFFGDRIDFESDLEEFIETGKSPRHNPRDEKFTDKTRSKAGISDPIKWGEVKVSANVIYPGVEVGFNLGQFADFLTGIVGYDLAKDDDHPTPRSLVTHPGVGTPFGGF